MEKHFSIKTIVAIGIGAALYIVLGRFATIPTGIPNTQLETTHALLALIAVVFGPIAGALVGLIGHALKDVLLYGSIWWSWVVVSSFVGLIIGLLARYIKIELGEFGVKQIVTFNIVQVVAQAIGWGIVAPTLDILVYAEPANKVWTQGAVAALSNIIIVGVLGTILLGAYAKTRNKKDSLRVE